jgi:rare lipoprotein A
MQLRSSVSMVLAAGILVAAQPFEPEQQLGSGMASFYASGFGGKRTASGEPYRADLLTAAHRTAAFGSRIRVTNLANDKSVVVRVNDRGPWSHSRIIDISREAAQQIGMIERGTARVRLTLVEG